MTTLIHSTKNINVIKIHSKLMKPKPSAVYDTYWKFAAERQNIFFRRLRGKTQPWTDDKILSLYKFTNAFRASDRVSQYLIKNIIYQGIQEPKEVLFRILLFKIFNKVETWENIEKFVGEIRYSNYSYDIYNEVLKTLKANGSIYSGAYIMASGKSYFYQDFKHQNHLMLIEMILESGLHDRLREMKNMKELYVELIKYPTIGSFLAYQYSVDINYSELTSFTEMQFVKAGPGALDGIKKCFSNFGDYSNEDIIKYMCDRQDQEFERLELNFNTLWGRHLQLIDCQNLFCEVDKYSRVAHPNMAGVSDRKRIKQKFKPIEDSPIHYFYPPKWGINENIEYYE